MAFAAYKRYTDSKIFFAFEGDEHRLPPPDEQEHEIMFMQGFWDFYYEKLPPNPVTILSTYVYMTEDPQLDSLKTIYELDRQLNIEARDDKEAEAVQKARREV